MPIQSFIPRGGLYRHQESSSLAPLSARNSPGQAWKSQRHDAIRSEKHTANVSQIQKQLARLERRNSAGNGMHPFKIYNFPSSLRRFHNADDWRRFKVRDADIRLLGSVAANSVWGSDLLTGSGTSNLYGDTYGLFEITQIPPTSNIQTNSDGLFSSWNEISIPVDHRNYIFWLCWILPTAGMDGVTLNNRPFGIAVCPEDDLTKAKIMLTLETFDATSIWLNLPFSDAYNQYIGSVMIDDGLFAGLFPGWPQISITQHLATNIELTGSPYGTAGGSKINQNFRGDYNALFHYYVGDVVTIDYADSSAVHSIYQYIYDPPADSIYHPINIPGRMSGVSPNGNSPDPWKMLSKSPKDADYHTDGSYQAAKAYLRTA